MAAAFLLGVGTCAAQLARVPNTTLNLPASLPAATGYTTTSAITFSNGTAMTFASPMCTAFPTGETNRLYVAQRAGQVRVVNSLSAANPSQAVFMDLAAYLRSPRECGAPSIRVAAWSWRH